MCEANMTLATLLTLSVGLNVWLTYTLHKKVKFLKWADNELEKLVIMAKLYKLSHYGKL
jgi:hypothetical protein